MKTKSLSAVILISFLALMSACNGNKTSSSSGVKDNLSTDSKHKYGIKSGIVHYTMNAMGMDMKYTLYFDDFGEKEATETLMEMMGMKSQTNTITKDGFVYSFDLEKKTGTKTSVTPQSGNIDFENISEEMKKEMDLQKAGEEVFLDKNCTKYSINFKKYEMKGTFLVWNGISLKGNFSIGEKLTTEMTAEKIEENVRIPTTTFDIPSDIKFE